MVCANCLENIERINQGYSAQNLPCSCTKTESFFYNTKQLIGLTFIIPFVLGAILFFSPVFLFDKVVHFLEY